MGWREKPDCIRYGNRGDGTGCEQAVQAIGHQSAHRYGYMGASQGDGFKVDRYGIPAQQDAYMLESVLIRTEADKAFLPTRCGFTWDQQTSDATELEIKHVTSLDDIETSIEKLQASNATVDVYNAQGTLVLSQTNIDAAKKSLPQGIYVVKGQKFAVK